MFGSSNPFGQASNSSPFGTQTQSVFGQTNNASSNPFAPKPFGTSNPFGAQTGSSMFGGTSTGVFGAPQTSSPFGATSQGFGSSTLAFGASSAPAFGSSSSPFGGTSTFGQKSFGFSAPQSSPFGSTTQQSQPAFGNNTFGSSTPFGASNTPAFGASNTFGSSTPFGASNTHAFGSSSTPAFGSSSTPAFGASNTPAFGASNTPAFGASSTPSFGASSSPAFGTSPTPAFRNNAFGASSTPSFSFGSSPAFGQSTSAFGSGSFASTPSSFGAQGAQAFGAQQGGSRVMPYVSTTDADSASGTQLPGKLKSISAMPVHKNKNHEELRWEDYQRGDKGGQLPAAQSGVITSQPSIFSQSSAFGQPSANPTNPFSPAFSQPSANPTNPFSSSVATNSFAQKTPTATTSFSSPFGPSTTPSMFASTSSTTTSVFGPSPVFSTTTSQPFASSSSPGFGPSPSMVASTPAFSTAGNFNNSQSSSLFSSTQFRQGGSVFSQPSSGSAQTSFSFGPASSAFAQNTNHAFPQTNNCSTPSTGFANQFTISPSLTTSISPFGQPTPPGSTSYQPNQPPQPSSAFSFNNFGQPQTANTNGLPGGMGTFSQGNSGPATANASVMQPNPVANPFGTLPASPKLSIAQGGHSPSIQYGISSMPVVDKPAPARVSPLLTSRHLLQRRVKLPARKYRPGDDGPKVPFFSIEQENSNTPKADAFFIPRENPRALFLRPVEKEKSAPPKDGPTPLQENGKSSNGFTNGANHDESKDNGEICDALPVKANQKPNKTCENHGGDKNVSNSSPSGADIGSLLPKLHHAEYFTQPRIKELAAKERVNPGYCRRVKDFVVGRHGYGTIKFLGETDVRKLDLEMVVQFSNREVVVYMDESKKPPVGQGLNKPAEVTLLNIKCIDKKSGKQVKEGPRVDKYKEMLKRKAEEQGAKFVSFDAVNGEWKFRVEHFSSYKPGDVDDE
ncbi:nuclear pore complex protein NUP98B [Eutrema salsugineum]|uniref:nuclear pore complex protein NUP98B n=1 Tax=Eutrema salsugineum TaxID=72664 RepID=UPI000CED6473|nr:nuclear pore complex protein NUP98B [Eutrema salsugineum]